MHDMRVPQNQISAEHSSGGLLLSVLECWLSAAAAVATTGARTHACQAAKEVIGIWDWIGWDLLVLYNTSGSIWYCIVHSSSQVYADCKIANTSYHMKHKH